MFLCRIQGLENPFLQNLVEQIDVYARRAETSKVRPPLHLAAYQN
jgi:hypothetical protein